MKKQIFFGAMFCSLLLSHNLSSESLVPVRVSLLAPVDAPQEEQYETILPEGDWEMIEELSDEFNGTSLDRTKWNNYHPYWSGRTPSQFQQENVQVKDGYLCLETSLADASLEGNEKKNWINTACVTSVKENCGYGYYEARVKACNLSMSNAFWFQSKNPTIEIDVTESIGNSKKTDDSYSMNMNTHDIRDGGWDNDITTPYHVNFPNGKKSSEEFFVYGVRWDTKVVEFYLDGKKVHEVAKDDFDQEMYMFFDIEAFTWQGLPTVEDLEMPYEQRTMYVDYVRAYRPKD